MLRAPVSENVWASAMRDIYQQEVCTVRTLHQYLLMQVLHTAGGYGHSWGGRVRVTVRVISAPKLLVCKAVVESSKEDSDIRKVDEKG
eukprot:gene10897-2972_t